VTATATTATAPAVTGSAQPRPRSRSVALSAARAQLRFVVVVLVATPVVWWALLRVFDVSTAIGKSPLDVAAYLLDAAEGGARRAVLGDALLVTLRDAALGYTAGLALAFVGATAFVLVPSTQRLFFPAAVLLRTFPLVVLAPLIILAFGRGLVGIAIIGVIVVFFDGLVIMTSGLRAVPVPIVELVLANGGSDLDVLRRVAVPTALPAVFTAAKLSFPVSLTGAMLAEWLATGEGVGAVSHQAPTQFLYAQMWSAVAGITVVSIVLYAVLQWLETVTHAAFDQESA